MTSFSHETNSSGLCLGDGCFNILYAHFLYLPKWNRLESAMITSCPARENSFARCIDAGALPQDTSTLAIFGKSKLNKSTLFRISLLCIIAYTLQMIFNCMLFLCKHLGLCTIRLRWFRRWREK